MRIRGSVTRTVVLEGDGWALEGRLVLTIEGDDPEEYAQLLWSVLNVSGPCVLKEGGEA